VNHPGSPPYFNNVRDTLAAGSRLPLRRPSLGTSPVESTRSARREVPTLCDDSQAHRHLPRGGALMVVPARSQPRVAFVQEAPLVGGGASSNSARKVRLLRDLGCHVTVIALSPRRSSLQGRVELAALYLQSIVLLRRIDLLYARLVPRALPLGLLAAWLGKRVVLEANGQLFGEPSLGQRLLNFMMRKLAGQRSVLLCGDDGHQGYYLDHWPNAKWHPLPLGVDETEFGGTASPVPDPSLPILFGGTLTKEQGVWELLRAFEMRIAPAGRELWIFGSGPEAQELATHAADQPAIRLFGQVEQREFRRQLSMAGVLVAPYPAHFREGYPISVLKVAEYAMTDRVLVVPNRDSLIRDLDLGEDDGVLTWSGLSVSELALVLDEAVRIADRGTTFPDRRAGVVALRGVSAQRAALSEVLRICNVIT